MKELRSVKFNVGMYDDIKLKMIDAMKGRDIIHYCLARFIVLAGKVNMDGYLFINENIPYTIETLSIEFNRTIEEIELSVKVLIDLEILELTKQKIYKVKNWAKHQNIKKKSDEYSNRHIKNNDNFCEDDEIKDINTVENILEHIENITEETINKTVNSNNNLEEGNKNLIEGRVLEGKKTYINKNLVEINALKDENKTENNLFKENSNYLRDKIIFQLKEEDKNSKLNSEKDITISKVINDDLKQESNKVEIKKKRGSRGRPKKSLDNKSKLKNIKKNKSLIQFSCDEYEDNDFDMKEEKFVTFVME